MKRFVRLVAVTAFAALLFGAAGCDSLPSGTPPEGNIVDNTPPPAESGTALHNKLVTELVAFALSSGLTALRPEDDGVSPHVAQDAARIVGFAIRPDAELRLGIVRGPDGATELLLRDADDTIRWRSFTSFQQEKK